MQRAARSHGKHAHGVPRLCLRLERRPVRIGPADRLAVARPPHGPALGAGGGLYVYPGIGVGLLAFPPTDSRRRDGPCRRAPRASGYRNLPRGSSNHGAAGRSCNMGPRSHRRKPKKGNAMNQKTIRLVLPILFAGAVAWAQTPPPSGQNQNPPPPPQLGYGQPPAVTPWTFSPGRGDGAPQPPRSARPPMERLQPQGRWWNNPEMVQKLNLNSDQQKKMDDILQQNRLRLRSEKRRA